MDIFVFDLKQSCGIEYKDIYSFCTSITIFYTKNENNLLLEVNGYTIIANLLVRALYLHRLQEHNVPSLGRHIKTDVSLSWF